MTQKPTNQTYPMPVIVDLRPIMPPIDPIPPMPLEKHTLGACEFKQCKQR
jgi:hypothetical protein